MGFYFSFVVVFAILGGSLRGFNLLLVLAALVLGVLLIHWRISRRMADSVDLKRRMPTEAFAGSAFRVRYLLTNGSRLVPLWSLRVDDRIRGQRDRSVGGDRNVGRDRRRRVTRVASCGLAGLAPTRSATTSFDCVIDRRGRYTFGPAVANSPFPLGLFNAAASFPGRESLYVYPKLLKLSRNWRRRVLSDEGGVSTTSRRAGRNEGTFFGLREYRYGDNPRWIHWRTTARMKDPAVKQFEQQNRFNLCLLVDPHGDDEASCARAEWAISLAATLVVEMLGRPSNRVVLATACERTDPIPHGVDERGRVDSPELGGETGAINWGGDEGRRRMLRRLAVLPVVPSPDLSFAIRSAGNSIGGQRDLVVVSSRSLDEARASIDDLGDQLQAWQRLGSFQWIDPGTAARWAQNMQSQAASGNEGPAFVGGNGVGKVDGVDGVPPEMVAGVIERERS